MNIIRINLLNPFFNMSRRGDYQEMIINSLSEAYSLNTVAKATLSVAVHHAYAKHDSPILSDVVSDLNELSKAGGANSALCDEMCLLMTYANDSSFPEHDIFCDRDGLPLNQLETEGLKAVLRQASNNQVRLFLERMIVYSLLF